MLASTANARQIKANAYRRSREVHTLNICWHFEGTTSKGKHLPCIVVGEQVRRICCERRSVGEHDLYRGAIDKTARNACAVDKRTHHACAIGETELIMHARSATPSAPGVLGSCEDAGCVPQPMSRSACTGGSRRRSGAPAMTPLPLAILAGRWPPARRL